MNFFKLVPAGVALLLAACAVNPVQVTQAVPASIQNGVVVQDVDVALSPLAQGVLTAFEQKAAEKRAAAGLPPVPAGAELTARPPNDQYATLPFANMMEFVIQDVTQDWGLKSGRPVRLAVEIDTLKTANAGMAILAGSSDQLSGSVKVLDAASSEKLGEFYVDVINSHSGLLGMAMRGGGIREKLAEEFALHVSQQLTGRKSKGGR